MTYQLWLESTLLGTSPLSQIDRCAGIAYGPFAPTEAYDLVRPVFHLFTAANGLPTPPERAEARARYYQARDALRLLLTSAGGETVATRWVHIHDRAGSASTAQLELQAALIPRGSSS
jgi:hypothetical protein